MAIAKELKREGLTSANVHLAVGLPLTWVDRQREDFYNHDYDKPDKEKVGEHRMKARDKETFKDELREVIPEEIAEPDNRTLQDMVNDLMRDYNVECRVKPYTGI